MSGNQRKVLNSIIKVEPEEFERISSDDVLRFKANIFSDPIVFVEPLNFKITTSFFPPATERKNEINFSKTVQISARKRIEKARWRDPHSCSICQKVFSSRRNLKTHFENVHNRSTRMLCDLCPKVFFTRHSINCHMRTVHLKKCFACNICDYKTAVKTRFQNHKMIHAAKVECPICLKQVSVLKMHMETHKKKVPCPICQILVQKRNFRAHMNKSHIEIKCTECDEVLNNKKDLRSYRHKLIEHSDEKIFECHCGSVFSTNGILKTHQKQVHSAEKPTCKVCQKQFSSGWTLKSHWKDEHLRTHGILGTGTKIRVLNRSGPFICDKCGSKHPTRNAFQSHNSNHHRNALFCDLCPRFFTQKTFLVLHIYKEHLKFLPYQCKDCEYKSFFKKNLKTHMKQHGSPTECKVCHKFVTNMYNHLRNHVKVKCSICSKIVSKRRLSRHLGIHKNINKKK